MNLYDKLDATLKERGVDEASRSEVLMMVMKSVIERVLLFASKKLSDADAAEFAKLLTTSATEKNGFDFSQAIVFINSKVPDFEKEAQKEIDAAIAEYFDALGV